MCDPIPESSTKSLERGTGLPALRRPGATAAPVALPLCCSASGLTRLEVHVLSSRAQSLIAVAANRHQSPDRCRLYTVVLRDRCASYRLLSLGLDAERLEVRRSAVVVRRAVVIQWTHVVGTEMVEGTDE